MSHLFNLTKCSQEKVQVFSPIVSIITAVFVGVFGVLYSFEMYDNIWFKIGMCFFGLCLASIILTIILIVIRAKEIVLKVMTIVICLLVVLGVIFSGVANLANPSTPSPTCVGSNYGWWFGCIPFEENNTLSDACNKNQSLCHDLTSYQTNATLTLVPVICVWTEDKKKCKGLRAVMNLFCNGCTLFYH